MPSRCFSNRRSYAAVTRTHAVTELLEDKRLLSATTGDRAATPIVDLFGPDRTPARFIMEQEVPDPGHSLTFEQIRIVGDEVWVLSEYQRLPGLWPQVIATAGDSVTVDIPDLPIRHFRIGGGAGLPPDTEVTHIKDLTEFYDLIGDSRTELLYGRIDPELAQWRQQVETQIIEQADALYGSQFGAETESPVYYYRGLPVFDDITLAAAEGSSDTNVQVAGVDEGDIVETDGDYIYTISGTEIVIVRAAAGESDAEVVSRVELAERPVAMFLHNDRLTVISQEYGNVPWWQGRLSLAPSQSRTVVTVLDVADRQAPMLAQETIFDGQYQSSRAIGDQVFVVINNNFGVPYVPELNTVYDESFESKYRFETREEYLNRVDELVNGNRYNSGLTPPSVYRRSDENPDDHALDRLGWLDGASNPEPDGGQLTSVVQVDASSTDSTPVSNIGVSTRQYSRTQVYASQDALYLVTEEYVLEDAGGVVGDIAFIPQPTSVQSRIHKIGIGTGQLVLEGEGVVPGNVESQFSIDEHNGYLRIVTTTGNNWWWGPRSSENHLFILRDTGDDLVVVGSVQDLAAGERIYSARFDGDRAWMVTFRQVDPVFSFDLSDPTNPHVTGELKIPGYSDHLQLIDENHLLAIGRNATEDGRVQEVQVSLFNIADMTQPKLLHRYSFDSEVWGTSEALQDHLAFNYLPNDQILAVPFGRWGQQGMALLHVDSVTGFEFLGQIDGAPHNGPLTSGFHWNRDNSYRRSVQIDDLLYAISAASISVVNLNDPETIIQSLKLQEERAPWHTVPELPIEVGPLDEAIKLTEVIGADGTAEELRLALDELLGDVLPDPDEVEEYEFRVRDRATGDEIFRKAADAPEVMLQDAGGGPIDPGTYDVQFRTKVTRLRNPEFGAWSAPETLSVRSEAAEMISETVLRFGQQILEWSRISDLITLAEGGVEFLTNPVDHYEIWINDANTNERVLYDRNVDGTQLGLDLSAGGYFAWFRAVYEDGSFGDWSLRERLEILGAKIADLISPGNTANTSPVISLPDLQGATSFEVEVTKPDGTIIVYDTADLTESQLQIPDELESGTYTFRVRANLATGVPTEWSDSVSFTIFDRPTVSAAQKRLSLNSDVAATVELWINKAGTKERVFHDTDFQHTTLDDAIATLGLDPDHLSGYDVWTRFTMADGSRTKWSPKAVLNSQLASFVAMNHVPTFSVADNQAITWNEAVGVESFELWVTKVGQSGAFRRVKDLTGLLYEFDEKLPEGNYRAWLRGKLINGLYTAWGQAYSFAVQNRPVLTIENQIASWAVVDDGNASATYELWINQIDDNVAQLSPRVLHETSLASTTFDLSSLSGGSRYRGWVRRITQNGDQTFKSVWSQGVVFETAATSVPASAFEDGVDIVLAALDRI